MLYVTSWNVACTPRWKYKFPAVKKRNSRREHLQDASLLSEVQARALDGTGASSQPGAALGSGPPARACAPPVPGDPSLSRERDGKGAAAPAPSARCCLEWRGCCAPGWEEGAGVAGGSGGAAAPKLPAAAPEPWALPLPSLPRAAAAGRGAEALPRQVPSRAAPSSSSSSSASPLPLRRAPLSLWPRRCRWGGGRSRFSGARAPNTCGRLLRGPGQGGLSAAPGRPRRSDFARRTRRLWHGACRLSWQPRLMARRVPGPIFS